ncbi:zinc finger protein 438 isoform X2 [Camelus ferus]|uniref:Zinc finger protein 438 n=2 Tax=Camelus ferus TaxID=419612 RepID=A0A8B8SIR9_CAMFR|nr:zinc finger protein 438 isoform X2 [Camelus ferus]
MGKASEKEADVIPSAGTFPEREVIIQVRYFRMKNSLSVPPKDQGEPSTPSGTVQTGKGLQSKSQFRTIAPKIVPKVLPPRVLTCPSPSLPDQASPGPRFSSKPLGMPTQNYALMQVAGQEGTFSLVALPHVASAQPIPKSRLPLPENLKLPIPRYQPPRKSQGARRKPMPSSSESSCSKPPAQTQAPPALPARPEPPPRPRPPELVLPPDQVLAGVGTAVLTNGDDHRDSRPPGTSAHADPNPPATPASSTPQGPAAKLDLPKTSGKANHAGQKASRKPATVPSEKLKGQASVAKPVTHLSPAVFGNTVQVVSSVSRGKLPILPYSRMKAPEVYKSESAVHTVDISLPGLRAASDKTLGVTEGFCVVPQVADKVPVPPVLKQNHGENAFSLATKPDLSHKTKLNGGAAKRKGRKRKVPDELLTFQGKRRKYVLNKCRDGKERVQADPQEARGPTPGTVRKYRSIMPKPATVPPAPGPPASPVAPVQPPPPSSPARDVLLSNPFSLEQLGSKQADGPSPKPSAAFRRGLSGLKKPWHRCHVCDHHFQFKRHLQEHMNTHTNRRPYCCRFCRKTYMRPGSLSAHVRLRHADSRPRKLMCCELCAKVFGHLRVYFGHLREVHRVVISTEPAPCEPQPGDQSAREPEGPVDRENRPGLEEDLLLDQADEVRLQIRCGRCQIAAPSFAEIKFHLLHVHGEEIQGRLQEGVLPGGRGARDGLRKHAAPSWKPRSERRKMFKHRPSDEELHAFPTLKKQLCLHQQNDVEILTGHEGAPPGPFEPRGDPQSPECPGPPTAPLPAQPGFNCILCAQTLGRKEDLLLHWEQQHNCEDPPQLWTIFHALSNRGVITLSSETEK